jgi:hypothetical protein
MPSTTLRYETDGDRLPAGVYWRRRFLALLAGIAVLGILVWAVSGVISGNSTGSNTADVGHLSPGHGQGTRAPGQPTATTPGPGQPGRAVAAAAPGGPPSCTPANVVISLFATGASYSKEQPAGFDVDVVSTAAGTCSFNVGPRYLALVVMAGQRRVWGSADCAPAPGSLVTYLARGVPVVLPFSWDLQTSSPGCAARAGQAGDGSYTATAAASGSTSNPVTFTLS